MKKIINFLKNNIFLLILVFSIPAVRYLFVHGFFGVSDDLHIAWLFEMDRAVKMLQFPPRFVPDLSFGFGYPLFNFVYPLPFYIGEIIHLLGFSLVNSVKIVFGLSIPFSMYFMYKFLHEFLSGELSFAGAVLYIYAPYRATEIFVRGTIGEITAFIFIPLIAWSIVNLIKENTEKKWIGILAVSFAGLILSHNIMAYMFIPFALLLLAGGIIWVAKDKKRSTIFSLSGIALGLISSLYFWFPAIYESKLMHYDTVFNFYDHFPTLKQLITPFFGYGASVPGPYDTMSFYTGLTGIFVAFAGLILFIFKFKQFSIKEKMLFIWGLVTISVSVFMMNYRSAFLWRSLPLLPYFQFPWRFLSMVTFAFPIFLLGFSKFKSSKIISYLVIAFALILNFNYFKISEYLGRNDDYYLNRYIPFPVASADYKKTSEEYLRLPKDTVKRPLENFPRVYDSPGAISVDEINALDAKITTNFPKEFTLNYSKYNFPGWCAEIDGKNTTINSGKPYGQINVQVPAGKHIVLIKYRETPLRIILDAVSLLGIFFAAYLLSKKTK